MKLLYQTTLFALLLLCATLSVVGQTEESFPTRQQSDFVNARPNYCWMDIMQLEVIKQHSPADKTIIVIARLGGKDSKLNLNKRRLHNVREYLTVGKHTEQSIILAEGEPIKGYGQVEFYLDGRLIEVIKVRTNGDFAVPNCYATIDGGSLCDDKSLMHFYPCKDLPINQKKKRKTTLKKNRFR